MSILGDIFGTSRSANTATTTSTPQVPADVAAARTDLLTRARAFAAEPFPQYNQPRVAGFTPDQQAGFQTTRNLAAQSGALGALTPELTQAGIAASRGLARALPDVDLSGYMSPFTQQVIDPAIRAIEERAAQRRLELGQQAGLRGSFGGSRQAIQESELERGTQRNISEETARLRNQAFNQAIQQFREDQTRIPGLYSTALGQLGTGLSQTGGRLATEAQPLINIGAAQQGLDQRNLDVLREAFLEERNFPTRGIDVLRGALGLTPNTLGIGTTGTSVAPSPNVAGSILTGISQAPQVIQGGTAVLNFLRGLGGTAGVSEGMFARGGLVNLSPGNN
jgi:hypothetical protein